MKNIVILGAGISGLATAHWLHRQNIDFTILEAGNEPGGSIKTIKENGYTIDFGPNSGLETSPFIRELVSQVGLDDEMVYANETSNKRYILKNDELMALPMSAGSFFKSALFSVPGKLRLLKEPFVGRSLDGYNQSIAEFVERRLGREFLDYAIDPFVSGVFAGDAEKLSVKSAFPKLYRLEEVYGGLVKGMVKGAKERKEAKKRNEESKQSAKMFSFKSGMGILPKTIVEQFPDRIIYGCRVTNVKKENGKFSITYEKQGSLHELKSDILHSTLPAHIAAKVFTDFDLYLGEHFTDVYHPPVKVLFAAYKKSSIKVPLDGFGFLIPSKEKKIFLGAIWSSVIFENRAPSNQAGFTIFIGGARNSDIFRRFGNDLEQKVLGEFQRIMKIDVDPVFTSSRMWEKAIPQYNLGYNLHEDYFTKIELENPGLVLSGNYRGGISIGDCFKNSKPAAERILNLLW